MIKYQLQGNASKYKSISHWKHQVLLVPLITWCFLFKKSFHSKIWFHRSQVHLSTPPSTAPFFPSFHSARPVVSVRLQETKPQEFLQLREFPSKAWKQGAQGRGCFGGHLQKGESWNIYSVKKVVVLIAWPFCPGVVLAVCGGFFSIIWSPFFLGKSIWRYFLPSNVTPEEIYISYACWNEANVPFEANNRPRVSGVAPLGTST